MAACPKCGMKTLAQHLNPDHCIAALRERIAELEMDIERRERRKKSHGNYYMRRKQRAA